PISPAISVAWRQVDEHGSSGGSPLASLQPFGRIPMLRNVARAAVLVATLATSGVVMAAMQGPWFSGTPDTAFALAKQANKPILVYWGAVWCPPCNELRDQVFNQPR